MNEADLELAALAERQFGVFARHQAAATGLSEYAMSRRRMSGRWQELFPGVYRVPGTTPTGRQRAMAAVLWAGPRAAVSHTTAARLLRLDEVRSDGLHVTVPPNLGLRTGDVVLHRSADLPRGDFVVVDGIRCTAATRTVIDCAAVLGDEELEAAFEQARRMGLTSPAALARRADEVCRRGRPGATRLRRLLAAQTPGSSALESRLEVKLARLLRRSALPAPQRQYPVGRFRLDFAWPAERIACECDGFEHHGSRLDWKRDRSRLGIIEAAGWRVVQVTWSDVCDEPERTLDRVQLALRRAASARRPASTRRRVTGSSWALVSNEMRWTRSPYRARTLAPMSSGVPCTENASTISSVISALIVAQSPVFERRLSSGCRSPHPCTSRITGRRVSTRRTRAAAASPRGRARAARRCRRPRP